MHETCKRTDLIELKDEIFEKRGVVRQFCDSSNGIASIAVPIVKKNVVGSSRSLNLCKPANFNDCKTL